MRWKVLYSLARCGRGSVGVEYALIAVLLAVGIVGSFVTLGNGVSEKFETIDDEVRTANQ